MRPASLRPLLLSLSLSLTLAFSVDRALGQSAPAPEDTASQAMEHTSTNGEWEISLAPYLWLAGLEARLAAGGVETKVDASFSDILDNLDVGLMAAGEARRDRWTVVGNFLWLRVSAKSKFAAGPVLPVGTRKVDAESTSIFVEGLVGYEVASLPVAGRKLDIDLRMGLRYWNLDNRVDVRVDLSPLPEFSRRFSAESDWADFLLGWRTKLGLTDKLALTAAGDFGGFGFGSSSSHFTWSVLVRLDYSLSERWTLAAGWRGLDVDRDKFDARMQGPLLAASYHF
jgi:hypothetical protein